MGFHQNLMTVAVMPAYNESATIGSVISRVKSIVDRIVVVDDGSSDDTAQIARNLGAEVITHPSNIGYGAALSTGLRYARGFNGSIVVVLDADGQHDPSEIPSLVNPIVNGSADIVTGSRFIGDYGARVPRYRRFGIGIINRAWNLACGVEMTDTQCGFRAYSPRALSVIDITESSMSASLEILDQAHQNELRIVEVPVRVRYDGDTSTMRPGRHGMELIGYVLRKVKDEHPLLILGGFGVAAVLVGALSGIYAMTHYMSEGTLPFGPTTMFVTGLGVGVVMVIGGLVLNSIQLLSKKIERL